ncbi:MAG: polysaccharide biosynthesis/export family protein [Candidatus Eisenbacteria bacterium]
MSVRSLLALLASVAWMLALATPTLAQDDVLGGGAGSGSGAGAAGSGAGTAAGSVGAGAELGSALAAPGAALESAINADDYRLGPGDVLTVGIWGPQPITYDLPVTLEGKVLLPSIGILPVDGLPLGEARAKIRERILKDFRNVDVTVTLTRLRKFQVHVLGQVERPGTYLASAVDRVSSAVNWAGGLTDKASQRRIRVQSSGSLGRRRISSPSPAGHRQGQSAAPGRRHRLRPVQERELSGPRRRQPAGGFRARAG